MPIEGSLEAHKAHSSSARLQSLSSECVGLNGTIYFENMERKLNRDLGKRWGIIVNSYQQITKDNNQPMCQELLHVRNVLSNDAPSFSLCAVQPYATAYQQAVTVLEREFNSPGLQNWIKNLSNSLIVRKFKATGLSVVTYLSWEYKLIFKVIRQVPCLSRTCPAYRIFKESGIFVLVVSQICLEYGDPQPIFLATTQGARDITFTQQWCPSGNGPWQSFSSPRPHKKYLFEWHYVGQGQYKKPFTFYHSSLQARFLGLLAMIEFTIRWPIPHGKGLPKN